METENKKYFVIVSLAVILVLAGVGGVYWLINRPSLKSGAVQKPAGQLANPDNQVLPTQNAVPANLAEIVAKLYQGAQISIADKIVTQQPLAAASLPAEISKLIDPNHAYLDVQSVKFVDGKSGYRIQYQVPGLIYQSQKFYSDLITSGWTISKAVHTNAVALTRMQKGNLDVLVEATVIDTKNINAIVTVVLKLF